MSALFPCRRSQCGVTLIELMVAMVLGLIVAGGIVTVFLSTSSSNRVQVQMARLQEDGRFAMGRLTDDISMATALYCNNTGGIATNTSSNVSLDGLRTPKVYIKDVLSVLPDNTAAWGVQSGTITYPAAPTDVYSMPSFMFMRGYTCSSNAASCAPIDPPTTVAPALGKTDGSRVLGTDVLTLRYLDAGRGWALGGTSTIVPNADNTTIANITLNPKTTEPPLSDFKSNVALLADCSNAQIFAVTGEGSNTIVPDDSSNFPTKPSAMQPLSAPRLFDFVNDFRTVTYYLKVVTQADGHTTGALIRRLNGTDQELVRGVERLSFFYGVEDSNGGTRYLTAAEVDSRAAGAISCPPTVPDSNLTTTDAGCLWRAVKDVEVSILMTGQQPLYTLTPPELAFSYSPDYRSSTAANASVPVPPDSAKLGITPATQGFDTHVLRREFNTLVSLRNYNP